MRVRRHQVLAVLVAAVVLAATSACSPDEPVSPMDEEPAPGATVGVLLTDDLPGVEWHGPLWDDGWLGLKDDTPLPRHLCKVPDVLTGGPGRDGLVAQASAAWRSPEAGGTVVSSVANRYENERDVEKTGSNIDRELDWCLGSLSEEDGSRVELRGSEETPVLEEVHEDATGTWRTTTAWATASEDVLVQVSVAWRDGEEPPVSVEELLPVALERTDTLPATSPRPGFPPACDDC